MKLWGFRSLRLGAIDVNLTNSGSHIQQKLAVCSHCDFCCPQMHVAECGHAFCERCVVDLTTASVEDATEDEADVNSAAICIICRRTVATMGVPIQERFVAQLLCTCPLCDAVLRVKELRDHFNDCVQNGDTRSRPASNPATQTTSARESPVPRTATYTGISSDHQHEAGESSPSFVPSELQSIIENRLNSIEERLHSDHQPTLPCYHTLMLMHAFEVGGVWVFRTPVVYLGDVGFYFAANVQEMSLYLWLASLEPSPRALRALALSKVTVRHGNTTHGPGMSVFPKYMRVGDSAEFNSFFDDFNRELRVITVCIDKVDS